MLAQHGARQFSLRRQSYASLLHHVCGCIVCICRTPWRTSQCDWRGISCVKLKSIYLSIYLSMSAWVWRTHVLWHTNSLVWECLWQALVSCGQTELHPNCIRSSCCSPTTSTLAVVPWLHPLQLATPRLRPLQLLLPDYVLLLPHTRSTKYNKYEDCMSLP